MPAAFIRCITTKRNKLYARSSIHTYIPGVSVVFGPVEGVHVEAALGNRSVGVRKVFTVAYVELEVALRIHAGRDRGGIWRLTICISLSFVVCRRSSALTEAHKKLRCLLTGETHPVVRADDDLHLDDRAFSVGLEDRVDAVLLPENVRPFGRRLLGITCKRTTNARQTAIHSVMQVIARKDGHQVVSR